MFQVYDYTIIMNSFKYFENRECKYYPCHEMGEKGGVNCLFCYCPLYALGTKCGGNYKITDNGVKDCSGCMFPHVKGNYDKVNERFQDIVEIAKKQSEE